MKQLIICLAISFSLNSCQKEDLKTGLELVVVKYLGNPASDGCGWVVEISNTNFSPQNLQEKYLINNLEIEVKYSILDSKSTCGFSAPISEISLEEVRLKI